MIAFILAARTPKQRKVMAGFVAALITVFAVFFLSIRMRTPFETAVCMIAKPIPALLLASAIATVYYMSVAGADLSLPSSTMFKRGLLVCALSFVCYSLGDLLLELGVEGTPINWVGVLIFLSGHWVHILGAYWMGVGANGSFTVLVDKSKTRKLASRVFGGVSHVLTALFSLEVALMSGNWIMLPMGVCYMYSQSFLIRFAFYYWPTKRCAYVSAAAAAVFQISDMILAQNGYATPFAHAWHAVMVLYYIAITVSAFPPIYSAFHAVDNAKQKQH